MTPTTTPTLTTTLFCPTTTQSVVGSSWVVVYLLVVVYFLWCYFVCNFCVAPAIISRAKHGRGFVRGNLLLENLFNRIHKLFVSPPRIAPIRETCQMSTSKGHSFLKRNHLQQENIMPYTLLLLLHSTTKLSSFFDWLPV